MNSEFYTDADAHDHVNHRDGIHINIPDIHHTDQVDENAKHGEDTHRRDEESADEKESKEQDCNESETASQQRGLIDGDVLVEEDVEEGVREDFQSILILRLLVQIVRILQRSDEIRLSSQDGVIRHESRSDDGGIVSGESSVDLISRATQTAVIRAN